MSIPTHDFERRRWSDRVVPDSHDTRTDLASVLRRLATDDEFAAAVAADPAAALALYRLTGNDLAALALWVDQPAAGTGIDALFDHDADVDGPPS